MKLLLGFIESCWCTGINSVFGNITKTETGKECQKWSEQYPHAHSQEGVENHCLVGTHSGPWCYTTDPDTRWEDCRIPECSDCSEKVLEGYPVRCHTCRDTGFTYDPDCLYDKTVYNRQAIKTSDGSWAYENFSLDQCRRECSKDENCGFVSWFRDAKSCYLRNNERIPSASECKVYTPNVSQTRCSLVKECAIKVEECTLPSCPTGTCGGEPIECDNTCSIVGFGDSVCAADQAKNTATCPFAPCDLCENNWLSKSTNYDNYFATPYDDGKFYVDGYNLKYFVLQNELWQKKVYPSGVIVTNIKIGTLSGVGNDRLTYSNGAGPCPNGAYRSGQITVRCGTSHNIISVTESPQCYYSLTATIICDVCD